MQDYNDIEFEGGGAAAVAHAFKGQAWLRSQGALVAHALRELEEGSIYDTANVHSVHLNEDGQVLLTTYGSFRNEREYKDHLIPQAIFASDHPLPALAAERAKAAKAAEAAKERERIEAALPKKEVKAKAATPSAPRV